MPSRRINEQRKRHALMAVLAGIEFAKEDRGWVIYLPPWLSTGRGYQRGWYKFRHQAVTAAVTQAAQRNKEFGALFD